MKVFILTDLEGVAGVNRWVQTRDGETPEKLRAMKLLTGEVNAAVEGILDFDPKAEIVVLDGHGPGGMWYEDLHPAAQVILHGVFERRSYVLDSSFDAYFFVGQHAMAGVEDAPLCHTYSSREVEAYVLNGKVIGEIDGRAALAGSFGVPTVFLSGDDKACAEARERISGIVTVEVKRGMGVELACHLSHEKARELIRAGAAKAMGRINEIAPYVIEGPYELEIRLLEGADPAPFIRRGLEQRGERTLVMSGDSLDQLLI